MENYAKIEQLHFDSDINTVDMDVYPEKYPLHWHQHVECIAIAKPNATVIVGINQREMTLKTGDIFLLMPGELHEIIDNSEKAIIALQFPMSLLTSHREFAAYNKYVHDSYYISYEFQKKICDKLLVNFNRIMEISKGKDDHFRNIRMIINLYEMIIDMVTLLQSENTISRGDNIESSYNDNMSAKIGQACSYIKTHCSEPITLESIAEYVGFSPCYFSRHFKELTTHSFVEYLLLQRLNRLQSLLTDKSISITEAAYQSGFKSISTMNRAFVKYCGCSPREYRNMYFK